MKTIQIYDPPLCCSSGVCGPEVDPELVNFAALLSQLTQKGVAVQRFNLGQQPMAFVENPKVKSLLDSEGTDALPLVFLDSEVYLKGRYPQRDECDALIRAALGLDGLSAP
jgi:sulfur carrier protein ThiS